MKVAVVHISSCTPSSKEMCGNIQPLYSKQSSYHSIHRKDTDEDERHITLCSYSLRSVHRKTLCDVWSKKEAPEAGKYTVPSHTPTTINCKLARFELCGSVWHIHHQSLCSSTQTGGGFQVAGGGHSQSDATLNCKYLRVVVVGGVFIG